jgi:hypothetical protein
MSDKKLVILIVVIYAAVVALVCGLFFSHSDIDGENEKEKEFKAGTFTAGVYDSEFGDMSVDASADGWRADTDRSSNDDSSIKDLDVYNSALGAEILVHYYKCSEYGVTSIADYYDLVESQDSDAQMDYGTITSGKLGSNKFSCLPIKVTTDSDIYYDYDYARIDHGWVIEIDILSHNKKGHSTCVKMIGPYIDSDEA